MDIVRFKEIKKRIIVLRDTAVILDSDVALLYGVETREINQAVRNNPRKFPQGYVIDDISVEEYQSLKSNFLILNTSGGRGQHAKYLPKAFTEKGLYMLATILKGEKAENTTVEIIDTFSRIRELSRTIKEIAQESEGEERNLLVEKGGEIISTILVSDLDIASIETSFEINKTEVKTE